MIISGQSLSPQEADRQCRAGLVVVSAETMAIFLDVERRLAADLPVSLEELESILYAIHASGYGDYHPAKVYA
jgi:hypothetical protein